MAELISHILFIGRGLALTLQLVAGGLIIGILLGTILSVLRYNKVATFLIATWVSALRGTPLILQLSFVYFTAPALFGIKLSVLAAGIFTFGINSSAYVAEILRAGIESLSKGQFEAARTLAIPPYYLWKDIILPQVIRNILPGLINEIIALLKETALIGTISGLDIMRMAQMLGAEQFTYFMPLCIAGAYYYILVALIEYLGKKIEQRGRYVNH
jgi:polar amino acid transport system permease protein